MESNFAVKRILGFLMPNKCAHTVLPGSYSSAWYLSFIENVVNVQPESFVTEKGGRPLEFYSKKTK